MKQVLSFLTLLLLTLNGFAQVTAPAAYNSTIKLNYVRTWDPVKPYSSDADVISSSRTVQEVKQATAYFDALGRPIQTVVKRGSMVSGSAATDLVTANVYDEYGREVYKYLPFVANSTGGNSSINDGQFKLNPFQQDSAFNKGIFSDESYFYSKTVFEPSPLNRPLETFAAGDNWVGTASQGSEANRRGIKTKYWVNMTADSVRIWTAGTMTSSSVYPAGRLYKNVTQDEHNKQVIEFKDKEGKVVLKKVQLTADADTGTGKNHTGFLCTYYVYDHVGDLVLVIQPAGVEILAANGWDLTYGSSVVWNEQCFQYSYDYRGRMITKKVPGAGTLQMIYDKRDRLVMTQDANLLAAQKWLYTLYDDLNRPIQTGLITDPTYYNNPTHHRSQAANYSNYPNPASYTYEVLTKNFYDDYSWRSGEGNPLSASRSSSYDGYLLSADNSNFPYPQDATSQNNMLRGMPTGSKTKVLGTSDYTYAIPFYDDRGKSIQVQTTNITGKTDILINQYSWTGQTLLTVVKHEKENPNTQTIVAVTRMSYDSLFRLVKTEKKISSSKVNSGSMPGAYTIQSEIEYDALGQLKKKKLGAAPLETLNYEYNIRGWMLGANRAYVKDTTSTANWFGFDLGYDKTSFTVNGTSHSYSAAQYNGNINGMLWRSTGDDYLRKYDFTYDAANRFLSAEFNQLNSNSFSKSAGLNFSVSGMSYDANGNIATMNQKGWKLGGSITIDSLLYGYTSGTNKLHYVHDRANDTASLLGDFKEWTNNTSQDYR